MGYPCPPGKADFSCKGESRVCLRGRRRYLIRETKIRITGNGDLFYAKLLGGGGGANITKPGKSGPGENKLETAWFAI
jgi:hypothetical protein